MTPFKELLVECRDDFMPILIGAIEGDVDPEWIGTIMCSDDFDVIIRSNFVLLPLKLLVQRLTEAATEDHKKILQSEKASAYIEKLGKWMDKFNKDQKADGEKEIEERHEFIAMLIGAIEGDRDPEWLGGYILSGDFDAGIRASFVLLQPAVVLKHISEIATDDQKKSLHTEKAAAYVAKIAKWLDEWNKAQKAAAAEEFAERLAAQKAASVEPVAPPVPAPAVPAEAVQAK